MTVVNFAAPCRRCGTVRILQLDPVAVDRWERGELIQNVFPHLDVPTRELMISNTCGTCWDAMFGGLD